MPRSFGPRHDPDGIIRHPRVASVAVYERATTLWVRHIAGGTITCELLRATTPATRIVRLIADYTDGDTGVQRVVHVNSELEEISTAIMLEREIKQAAARSAPTAAPAANPSAP